MNTDDYLTSVHFKNLKKAFDFDEYDVGEIKNSKEDLVSAIKSGHKIEIYLKSGKKHNIVEKTQSDNVLTQIFDNNYDLMMSNL